MNPKTWLQVRDQLITTANDEAKPVLDRIDALLELSQLYQRDDHMRAVYVQHARTLIRKNNNG